MKTVKLGDVCATSAGGTPPKSHNEYYDKGVIPWLQSGEINKKNILSSKSYITEMGLANSSAKVFPAGTVLIAMYGATAGQVGILRFKSSTNQAVCGILPSDKYLPDYLYYFFLNHKSNLIAQAVGNAQPNISQEKIKNVRVPVISIEEQRWVVERLDAAYEKIDRTIELTEKNIKNTDALFGSLLDKIVRQNPDVEDRSISEIADIEYGLTEKSKAKGDYRLIRITDINNEGFLTNENKAYVSASQKSEKYLLHNGDIVVARTGATFGKVLFFDDEENAVFASYLIRINFNEKILPKLFWYFAKTPQYWDQANALAGGAAQPQFNGNALKRVKFSYPASRNEQQAIIEILDTHHQSTLKLKTIYQKKLDGLNALKQALLTQAFSQDGVK